MQYDIEANIISWELTKGPINNTIEIGNFIVHLSKAKKPILIEILNASKFIGQMDKAKEIKNLKKQIAEAN